MSRLSPTWRTFLQKERRLGQMRLCDSKLSRHGCFPDGLNGRSRAVHCCCIPLCPRRAAEQTPSVALENSAVMVLEPCSSHTYKSDNVSSGEQHTIRQT